MRLNNSAITFLILLVGCAPQDTDDEGAGDLAEIRQAAASSLANNAEQNNLAGASATFSMAGSVSLTGPFFQNLGDNGRRCVDCHQPDQGFSITPSRLALKFATTSGTDPVFRPNDGATSPNADVSTTAAKRTAYSLLLGRGLIRVGLGIPAGAEFTLDAVDDPYGYASAGELSLFRRPLPATNLRFQTLVMWDGRESPAGRDLDHALLQQSEDATLGHAQATLPPTAAQKRAIVDFEFGLFTAQIRDSAAAGLSATGAAPSALGGPQVLAAQPFHQGVNDPLGDPTTGAVFDPHVFNLFGAWLNLGGTTQDDARASIARGEVLFNTKPLQIRNVGGINDNPDFGSPAVLVGTCGTCHNTPNVGSESTPRFLNIGIGGPGRRTIDMPLYTLKNTATGETIQTEDPGRALITGKWSDVMRFKVPSLRALSARAPYFHNGQAIGLDDVVSFYNGKFRMGMTDQEKADLTAFLKAL